MRYEEEVRREEIVQLETRLEKIERGKKDKGGCFFRIDPGCFAAMGLGLAGLIGAFTLGPIDAGRTAYNAIVGDSSYLQTELVDYVQEGIQREHPDYSRRQVERALADELGYELGIDLDVDPQGVRMKELWDASEKYAPNLWDQFIWPSLD